MVMAMAVQGRAVQCNCKEWLLLLLLLLLLFVLEWYIDCWLTFVHSSSGIAIDRIHAFISAYFAGSSAVAVTAGT